MTLYQGVGVHVFLMDSGVDVINGGELLDHKDNLINLPCLVLDQEIFSVQDKCTSSDLLGHGTRVAAIVAGDTLGVSKKVQLYTRKITNETFLSAQKGQFLGQGATEKSKILALKIDQIVNYITSNGIPPNQSIINFSAGFHEDKIVDLDPAFEQALVNARNAGVLIVIAAGNDPLQSANNISPGRLGIEDGIIDVAGVDINLVDSLSDGTFVDMYAPGVGISIAGASLPASGGGSICSPIVSTCNLGGNLNGTTLDGSSFAAPYVTAVAAKYIEYAVANNIPHDPASVEIALKNNAISPSTLNVLGNKAFVNSRFLLLEPDPLVIKSEYCFGFNSAQWSSPKGVFGVANNVDAYTLTGSTFGAPEVVYFQGLGKFNLFSVESTTNMYMKACKGNYCSTKVNGSRQARNYGSFCY